MTLQIICFNTVQQQPSIKEDIEFQTEIYQSDKTADTMQLRRFLKDALRSEPSFRYLSLDEQKSLSTALMLVSPLT